MHQNQTNYPLIQEGVEKLKQSVEVIVDLGMRAQNPQYPDNKIVEGFDVASQGIIDVLRTWQPIFDEISKEFSDAKQKAEKKVEKNTSDDTKDDFHMIRLNPKEVSEEWNNRDIKN
ncbi:hypothetical protein IEE_05180 [Bacillus cereus BAG5X1-1]|uniref:Uncharacterized protein n=1 Tax=Bacillus cereus BAG5X1-1 TaxID=1053189 RepID=J7ZMN1_BACCE|nr:hypothetical protein [Bacillus cereus]EJQ37621.1 hypothetical protein IEE_05180 [Bacillus cereus BAG5X1-1]